MWALPPELDEHWTGKSGPNFIWYISWQFPVRSHILQPFSILIWNRPTNASCMQCNNSCRAKMISACQIRKEMQKLSGIEYHYISSQNMNMSPSIYMHMAHSQYVLYIFLIFEYSSFPMKNQYVSICDILNFSINTKYDVALELSRLQACKLHVTCWKFI